MEKLFFKKRYFIFLIFLLLICLGFFFYSNKFTFFPKKPKTIIFITIDALRADHLSCYGYKRNTSPFIDLLAKDGVVFTQAISAGTFTYLTMPSMATSLYVCSHEIDSFWARLKEEIVTLAEFLVAKDYRTVFFGPKVISTIQGYKQGFIIFSAGYQNNDASYLTDRAIDVMKEFKDEPVFLRLHYFDTHYIYDPPAPYNKLFLDEISSNPLKELEVFSLGKSFRGRIPNESYIEGQTNPDYYIAQYDGEISYVDDQIERLWTTIKELGREDETLIIIAADHGELLGEHGLYFTHSQQPFDPLLKIPLIFYYKNRLQPRRINCQVSALDIMPTILDFCRIEIPKGIKGWSLKPFFQKEGFCKERALFLKQTGMSVARTSKYKLFHFDKEEMLESLEIFYRRGALGELFQKSTGILIEAIKKEPIPDYFFVDLQKDPGELVNRTDFNSPEFLSLKQKLDDWEGHCDSASSDEKGIGFLTDEDFEHLRSLGYVS